jgi:hypothetical protein
MAKGARTTRTARTAHTRQKPKPRLVSKAHRLEQDENLGAGPSHDAVSRAHRRDNPRKKA